MGHESFFLDPYGEIRPCNVMEETMGNLKERSFDEIWNGFEAERIRDKVRSCKENCWMIGNVGEIMKKNIITPIKWIIKRKFLKQEC
jgi:MoaA/NifB/PqqE/SkfB family radical SAM enzyme